MHDIAIAWLVLTLTGSPLTLGAVLITGTVPRTALMVFGGALSDRFSARAMLVGTNVVRAVLALLLAGLVVTAALQLWELYVLEFLFGAADGLFLPAIGAVVPDTVPEGQLVGANALIGASEQATMLGGPAVGGVVVAGLGIWLAFAFNGLTFVAAALGALPVRVKRHVGNVERRIVPLVAEGISMLRTDPQMRAVFALSCAASLSGGAVFIVGLPTLARMRLGWGATGLGLIYASWGLGQLIGTLGAARTGLPSRWGWLLIATAAVDEFVYLTLGATHSAWLVFVLLVPFGILVAYASDVARPVWIQRHSPPAMIGRAFSLMELPFYSVAPIGMLIFGAIASRDLGLAFAAAAAVSALAAIAALSSSTIRRLAI